MMMAPPVRPHPEADAAAVGAVPVRRWRVAAAVLLDYLAFCVPWAVAGHLLASGPPPPAWAALPVFGMLEWVLLRHRHTPGMDALSLARIPAGPGHFLWVADQEPARRENTLSVLTGVLFMAGGLRLWAVAATGTAALPPVLPIPGGGAGTAGALLWGLLSLAAGLAFLRLVPRAPVVGVFMLLATLTSLALRPEAWGAWVLDGPAVQRALAAGRVAPDLAAWLQVWFPVAGWLTGAVVALAVACNRRPFRAAPAEPG
jgi:hypothetical protein